MTYEMPTAESVTFRELLTENKVHFVTSKSKNDGYVSFHTCRCNLDAQLTLFKRAVKMKGYV